MHRLLNFSIFGVSELIFLNRNNYLKQTYYFLTAFFVQLLCIIFLINEIGILAFPISISIMFVIMSILIFLSLGKSEFELYNYARNLLT